MKTTLVLLVVLIILVIGYQGLSFFGKLKESRKLVQESRAFSYHAPDARMRILVLGDSTAVGTGVSESKNSTAGRLHNLFPESSLQNLAENGATLKDARNQLASIEEKNKYDLILIQAGANNLIRFHSQDDILNDARSLMREAKAKSETVVYLCCGNIGAAPMFPYPISSIYTLRAKTILPELEKLVMEEGVRFVDLYFDKANDPFSENPEKYYAPDFLHLSDEGYGVWFGEIKKAIEKE